MHTDKIYADSPFTQAFMKAHATDMKMNPEIIKGIGPGENLAFNFYLDSQLLQVEALDESQRK